MKNKFLFTSFTLLSSMLFLVSCGDYLTAINLKNATEPPIGNYESDSKKMRFIGVAHIAKPELYQSIKQEITKAKKDGYVLFWEYVDFDDANDTELRKVRKMLGFVPSPEGHARQAKKDLENGYAAQDNDMFLGLVNNKDFNVDITPTELVGAYEKTYGEIILDQKDKDTPIDEEITETLPPFNVMYIIKDYRNTYLAGEIEKSNYDKIIVLYGALHQKGLYSDLKKLDDSWKKSK